ncbi:MAG: cadmium-translocating P-type ATPase [Thermoprotei archaeon]|nr:MAG: cadmium-translocating P-type ATPase [Thermoprotei archaeon]
MENSRENTVCAKCNVDKNNVQSDRNHRKTGDHEHGEEEAEESVELYRILSSTGFYIVGLFLKFVLGIDNIAVVGLFILAYILVGLNVLKLAARGILGRKPLNENFLLTVATLGAFAIKEYPEAAGVMLFFRIGEYLQDLALNRSRRSIRALLSLKAEYANLKVGDKILKVKPEDVKVGDTIIVRPGEKIPLDGKVIKGSSAVDTSALTGESAPRSVEPGDEVLSGMINLSGLLEVKVTRRFSESTIAKILDLVEKASARKARAEKFITKFARYYTPAVVTLAAIVAFLPPLVIGDSIDIWVYRALVLLVISCPCALVLSIPLGYFGGIGRSAKEGILVKGSNFLDLLTKLEVVAFDKTGTLTKGVFKVSEIVPRNGFSRDEVLRFAALAEVHSNHPIAQAIKEAYPNNVNSNQIEGYEEIAGHGVKAKIGGISVMVGNDRLLHKEGVKHDICDIPGGTVVHVVVDKIYAGYIIISDEIKKEAFTAIEELRRLGVRRIIMLTGDSRHVARAVADKLQLDEYYAELLPEDKVKVIEKIRSFRDDGGAVAFVGDGVNDAPVIARADVGVAMGALGSDAAIEIADLVIMDDKLVKIPMAVKIAKKTRKIVFQNIILALLVKFFFLGLGIVGEATMWQALFADVGVALMTTLNAMRILK